MKGKAGSDLPTSPATLRITKPYFEPIEWIHRGNDGWIPFARIDKKGNWENLYSAPAQRIPTLFDSLIDDLEKDSYYGINSFIHPGGKNNPRHSTLPRPMRRADKVKYLNANWVDLDFYNLGMELHEVVAGILQFQAAGFIPPASFFADSGRGLWVFWLLADSETGQGFRAWPDKKITWAQIQSDLHRRLMDLGSDKKSLDLSRVTRVPGSINTKVSRRVAYWIQADRNGLPFMYSLKGLKASLGITAENPTPLEIELTQDSESRPGLPARRQEWDGKEKTSWGSGTPGRYTQRAKKGYNARWVYALNDFKILQGLRGAFGKGTRNHAALIYAAILWRHKYAFEDIFPRVNQLGMECKPPLSNYEIKNAVTQARKIGKIHNGEIADLLKITPDESAFLEKWPPMGTPRPEKAAAPGKVKRTDRQAAIQRIIDESKRTPTLREIRAILLDRDGLDAALDTLARDLETMNVRRRVGKKNRKEETLF